MSATHPDDESIARFAAGAADDGERTRVEVHVDRCRPCRDRLGAVAAGPTPRARPRDGDRIGRYVVKRAVGRGGMGVVVAAHDPELDREVAIKLVHPALWKGASDAARALLRQEARAMARLGDPNVVAVHDLGTDGEQPFVAMELVQGGPLHRWLRERPRGWRQVLDVCCQAGRGIAAAHRAGIVHRDVKPHNVLIDEVGRARIADFGLAAALGAPGGRSLAGTPAYMSPEQHHGAAVGPASDQFSFCVMVHEALFGERPFAGATMTELADAVCYRRPRPAPRGSRVPRRIRRALVRGMAADPVRRFPTMEALLEALQPLPIRRTTAAAIAVMVAAASGAALGAAAHRDPDHDARRDAVLRAARIWSPARRGGVEPEAAARIDGQIAAWIDAQVEAERRDRAGDDGAALSARRAACLRRRLAEVDVVIGVLEGAGPIGAARATAAVAALDPPATCVDPATLDAAPPADPARLARIEALEEALQRARAVAATGAGEARAALEAVVASARELDHAPLTAEALYQLGGLLHDRGALDEADRALVEGIEAASRGGADLTVARLWIERLQLAVSAGRAGDLDDLALAARSAVARAGDPAWVRVDLLQALAIAADLRGAPAEAEARCREALALARAVAPDDDLRAAVLTTLLGHLVVAQGRHADAVPVLQEAYRLARAALGDDHPDLAGYLINLAIALRGIGRATEAEAASRRAVALAAPGSSAAAFAMHGLAADLAPGSPAEAEALLRRVLASPTAPSMLRFGALVDLAILEHDRGDRAAARGDVARALEIGRGLWGDGDRRLETALVVQQALLRDEVD